MLLTINLLTLLVSEMTYESEDTAGIGCHLYKALSNVMLAGIGWNMNYPFNTGDLICCGQCAANYLDNNAKVPWEDLRYIFGEIMYGGHIVEDWDRRLAAAYLSKYFNEGLLEASEHFPALPSPPSSLSTVQARSTWFWCNL